jgi:hypothetical protein
LLSLGFPAVLQTQAWYARTFDLLAARLQSNIAGKQVVCFYFVNLVAALSLDSTKTRVKAEDGSLLLLSPPTTPSAQSEWIVEHIRGEPHHWPPNVFVSYIQSLGQATLLTSSTRTIAALKNKDTKNYLQALPGGQLICGHEDVSLEDHATQWKLIRVPEWAELEMLWKFQSGSNDASNQISHMQDDINEYEEEVETANKRLGELKSFIRYCSDQQTSGLQYLQKGQYQSVWPWYNGLEAHVRGFVQRGYRN